MVLSVGWDGTGPYHLALAVLVYQNLAHPIDREPAWLDFRIFLLEEIRSHSAVRGREMSDILTRAEASLPASRNSLEFLRRLTRGTLDALGRRHDVTELRELLDNLQAAVAIPNPRFDDDPVEADPNSAFGICLRRAASLQLYCSHAQLVELGTDLEAWVARADRGCGRWLVAARAGPLAGGDWESDTEPGGSAATMEDDAESEERSASPARRVARETTPDARKGSTRAALQVAGSVGDGGFARGPGAERFPPRSARDIARADAEAAADLLCGGGAADSIEATALDGAAPAVAMAPAGRRPRASPPRRPGPGSPGSPAPSPLPTASQLGMGELRLDTEGEGSRDCTGSRSETLLGESPAPSPAGGRPDAPFGCADLAGRGGDPLVDPEGSGRTDALPLSARPPARPSDPHVDALRRLAARRRRDAPAEAAAEAALTDRVLAAGDGPTLGDGVGGLASLPAPPAEGAAAVPDPTRQAAASARASARAAAGHIHDAAWIPAVVALREAARAARAAGDAAALSVAAGLKLSMLDSCEVSYLDGEDGLASERDRGGGEARGAEGERGKGASRRGGSVADGRAPGSRRSPAASPFPPPVGAAPAADPARLRYVPPIDRSRLIRSAARRAAASARRADNPAAEAYATLTAARALVTMPRRGAAFPGVVGEAVAHARGLALRAALGGDDGAAGAADMGVRHAARDARSSAPGAAEAPTATSAPTPAERANLLARRRLEARQARLLAGAPASSLRAAAWERAGASGLAAAHALAALEAAREDGAAQDEALAAAQLAELLLADGRDGAAERLLEGARASEAASGRDGGGGGGDARERLRATTLSVELRGALKRGDAGAAALASRTLGGLASARPRGVGLGSRAPLAALEAERVLRASHDPQAAYQLAQAASDCAALGGDAASAAAALTQASLAASQAGAPHLALPHALAAARVSAACGLGGAWGEATLATAAALVALGDADAAERATVLAHAAGLRLRAAGKRRGALLARAAGVEACLVIPLGLAGPRAGASAASRLASLADAFLAMDARVDAARCLHLRALILHEAGDAEAADEAARSALDLRGGEARRAPG